MKTLTATAILSIMFLSAGAFAGDNRKAPDVNVSTIKAENVTIVNKNQAWPPAGRISVDPCSFNRCIDI